MCGIVGYIGYREAQPILVDSLEKLEYRGYDSCGIALCGSTMILRKDVGRITELEKRLSRCEAHRGIGHTRWATHGKPSQANAHPHLDCTGKIAVVHNGVIINFQQLREQLTAEGHHFYSDTDTEVIPHLIEKYYSGDLEQAVYHTIADLVGSFAFAVLHEENDVLIVARKESPLVIGIGDKESFIASDVSALLNHTSRVIYLEENDFAVITGNGVRVVNQRHKVWRKEREIPWSVESAQKGGYEHFMLKEIYEQPTVVQNALREYLSLSGNGLNIDMIKNARTRGVLLLACGTSYYATLLGKQLLEKIAKVPVWAEVASEFNYSEMVSERFLAVAVSQSGETSDTVKALKKAKSMGCMTLAITNVLESSISRVADQTLYTRAGPEIGVAATKSFTAQLMALYWLALSSSAVEMQICQSLLQEMRLLPDKIQQILDNAERIIPCSQLLAQFEHVFFVSRGLNFPIALEGALKMKEISYIHAEGYAAGETKHGTFALLTPKTPVIAITSPDNTYDVLLTNLREMKARDVPLITIASENDQEIDKFADEVIRIPDDVNPLFSPLLNTVVVQLLAYYTARERGCSIDMPRNLAKSVTVE